MTNHSAVRVVLEVVELERLLREAYEKYHECNMPNGANDSNWERLYAQYVIDRLATKDLSRDLFDPGSTSDSIAESGEILPPPPR